MCGRYASSTDADGLVRFFIIDDRDPRARDERIRYDQPPRFNVAPTDPVPAVVRHDGQLVLSTMRWGLVPFWADDPRIGARMINARAETVADRRAFAESFERRRCLLPADGFYEWQRAGGQRLPWFVHRTDGDPMVFAGIWSSWRDPADRTSRLVTCSIITTTANGVLAPVHDRMPVVLDRADWDAWLDPDADLGDLRELLGPAPDAAVTRHRVSTRVNSVRNDDPGLLDPLDGPELLVGPQPDPPGADRVGEDQPTLFG
jgi:putative SOS response-associated peptidase YedK